MSQDVQKFLDFEGLEYYHSKIKNLIASLDLTDEEFLELVEFTGIATVAYVMENNVLTSDSDIIYLV